MPSENEDTRPYLIGEDNSAYDGLSVNFTVLYVKYIVNERDSLWRVQYKQIPFDPTHSRGDVAMRQMAVSVLSFWLIVCNYDL